MVTTFLPTNMSKWGKRKEEYDRDDDSDGDGDSPVKKKTKKKFVSDDTSTIEICEISRTRKVSVRMWHGKFCGYSRVLYKGREAFAWKERFVSVQ